MADHVPRGPHHGRGPSLPTRPGPARFGGAERGKAADYTFPEAAPPTIIAGNRLSERVAQTRQAMNQSYMDVLVQQALRNADAARRIQNIQFLAGDSVLPTMLDEAGNQNLGQAGRVVSAFGPLLSSSGNLWSPKKKEE